MDNVPPPERPQDEGSRRGAPPRLPGGDDDVIRKVADAAPGLLSYWGLDGRNVYANATYAKWFGMSPDGVRGKHLREVLGEEAYNDDLEYIEGVLRGAPQRFERDVVGLDGTVRAVVTCTPDIVAGQVVGFSVAVTTTAIAGSSQATVAQDGPAPLPVRVLIVDPDPLARAGLRTVLTTAAGFEVVAEACGVVEATTAALEGHPDVVVIDVRLPGAEALFTTRRAWASEGSPPPGVLVLTMSAFDEFLFDPLGAGASVVLRKHSTPDEIIEGVRAAASGGEWRPQQGTEPLFARAPWRPTPREREVLELVLRGFSNREIAARLYMSVDTVKTHLKHIYAKLGVRDRWQLIAGGRGLA
jgi:PAS domain S-box-containing protein